MTMYAHKSSTEGMLEDTACRQDPGITAGLCNMRLQTTLPVIGVSYDGKSSRFRRHDAAIASQAVPTWPAIRKLAKKRWFRRPMQFDTTPQ